MNKIRHYALAAIVATALCLSACEPHPTAEDRAVYAAWCKLNNRTDINITEWQLLRENYMLPGGEAKRAHDESEAAAAAAAAALAISVSNSANSTR